MLGMLWATVYPATRMISTVNAALSRWGLTRPATRVPVSVPTRLPPRMR